MGLVRPFEPMRFPQVLFKKYAWSPCRIRRINHTTNYNNTKFLVRFGKGELQDKTALITFDKLKSAVCPSAMIKNWKPRAKINNLGNPSDPRCELHKARPHHQYTQRRIHLGQSSRQDHDALSIRKGKRTRAPKSSYRPRSQYWPDSLHGNMNRSITESKIWA